MALLTQAPTTPKLMLSPQVWAVEWAGAATSRCAVPAQSQKCGLLSPRSRTQTTISLKRTRQLSLVAADTMSSRSSESGRKATIDSLAAQSAFTQLLHTDPVLARALQQLQVEIAMQLLTEVLTRSTVNDQQRWHDPRGVASWLAIQSSTVRDALYDDDCPSMNNAMHCQDNMGAPLHIAC